MDSPASATNSAFLPGTQIQYAWDSTSLGLFKECPAKYKLRIIDQWEPRSTSPHLTFGRIYHSACEHYDHAIMAGVDHEAALHKALRHVLRETWISGRPWNSDHPVKNRLTLARTVVWYLDQFQEDPFVTVQLCNGLPAVELSFKFATRYQTAEGQPYLLCGHLDKLARLDGRPYIMDKKTTTTALSTHFFATFTPDNQLNLYAVAANAILDMPVQGIVIDAAQIGVTFSRFLRGTINRTESQLREWYDNLGYWLSMAEHCATSGVWPQNEKSCGNYGGCTYRSICSKSPTMRPEWLAGSFQQAMWNPLIPRGNVS